MLCATPVLGAETTILAFGDSLTAGYGLAQNDAFPVRLEAALKQRGYDCRVINAGISGDTTAGGAARLDWSLSESPDLVIVELGANDALRGLDPAQTEVNLGTILERLQRRQIPALLTGMKAPRNFGEAYYNSFDTLYPRLAERFNVPLFPFFLEGVAGVPELNQGDGIHPNAAGVDVIVANILPYVERLIRP